MTNRLGLILTLVVSIGFGCSKKDSNAASAANSGAAPDFLQSSIVSAGTAVADGQSVLTVNLRLLNFDGSPIVNYTPVPVVTPSNGVTIVGCTSSDANGAATCQLKSVISGSPTFSLSGFPIHLETLMTFSHEQIKEHGSLSVAKFSGLTTDGYKMNVTVGKTLHGFNSATRDGYRFQWSAQ